MKTFKLQVWKRSDTILRIKWALVGKVKFTSTEGQERIWASEGDGNQDLEGWQDLLCLSLRLLHFSFSHFRPASLENMATPQLLILRITIPATQNNCLDFTRSQTKALIGSGALVWSTMALGAGSCNLNMAASAYVCASGG